MTAHKVVVDTNVVLDAFVFNDPAAQPLLDGLRSGVWSGYPPNPCARSWSGFWPIRKSSNG